MSSTDIHEKRDQMSPLTLDLHRAIESLQEEIEAVDWYQQRGDATGDDELRAILAHNRDEEKEHACMLIEWIRRRDPIFDEQLRRFLFTEGPIVDAERRGGENDRRAASLVIGGLRAEVSA